MVKDNFVYRHSLHKEHPGEMVVDAWGWWSTPYYQRSAFSQTSVDLDYFKSRVIEESYRWGANLLKFSPWVHSPLGQGTLTKGYLMSCLDEIPGGKHVSDKNWNDETLRELTEYAHKHGLMFHWFICHELIPGMDEEIHREFLRKKEALTPGERAVVRWTYPFDGHTAVIFNKEKIKANLDAIEKVMRDYADLIKIGWKQSLDGYGYEHGFIDEDSGITTRLWQYNPGMYLHSTSSSFVKPPDEPNYIRDSACGGVGSDDGGREEQYSRDIIRVTCKDFPHLSTLYLATQLDARPFACNTYGGTSFPDWFVKQCNDFFRKRMRNPDRPVCESIIWWLGEPENICIDGIREYVYAISQDPIKAAITTSLRTTGIGGIKNKENGRIIYNHTSGTSFIQNNYLRLYIPSKGLFAPGEPDVGLFPSLSDGGELVYDKECLAHYDIDSKSIPLTSNFINLGFIEKPYGVKTDVEYVEYGGQKAVLKEYIFGYIKDSSLREIRTYSMLNDTPYFKLLIERSINGKPIDINTIFGCEGYDRLVIDNTNEYDLSKRKKSISSTASILRFHDKKGIKPDLVFLILEKGNIEAITWLPSGKLSFQSKKVKKEKLSLAIVVSTDLYGEDDLIILKKVLAEEDACIKLKDGKGEVINKHSIPLVKAIKVDNTNKSPYFVEEYGWWLFRGAQPSEEDKKKTDYVKVYLKANGKAKLQQKEYIDDILRPGWGCQYTMIFKDIESNERKSGCTTKVLSVTPFIFAPRVEFKEKIVNAKVDGKPWHYFDENILFLPNKEGIYQVEVNHKGENLPHLRRTYAYVEQTNLEDNLFEFKANLPVWVKSMPDKLYFTAILDLGKRKIKKIEGAEVAKTSPKGTLIKFKPGRIRIFI
ncbi:hypothetical protein KAW08_00625 [bacterium]|nr:hypothetical protein [bacterium]